MSVRIVDKVERTNDATGEGSVSTLEYEFSEYKDFTDWEDRKIKAIRDSFTQYNVEVEDGVTDTLKDLFKAEVNKKPKETKH